jgi:hypothetical protein
VPDVTTVIPDRSRLDEPLAPTRIEAAADELRAEAAFASDGRNARTVLQIGPARILVGVIDAERDIGAQDSDGYVSIFMCQGSGSLAQGEVHTPIAAGTLAVLAPGTGWSLRALEPCAYVASFWQPA